MKELVGQAIESCLENIVDSEVVVVDDGSSDGTYDFLREAYGHRKNIVIHRFQKNMGKVSAFNKAFSLSSGKTITLLGADDIVLAGRNRLIDMVLNNEGLDLGVGSYFIADSEMVIKSYKETRVVLWPRILKENGYPGGAMVLSRKFANRIFPINTEINNEDYIIALNACFSGNVTVTKESVLSYRRHSNNTWAGLKVADRFRKGAERDLLIIDEFKKSQNKFSSEDVMAIEVASSMRRLIAAPTFLDIIKGVRDMLKYRYSIKILVKSFVVLIYGGAKNGK